MNCPKCGGKQRCPCVHCVKHRGGKLVVTWKENPSKQDMIACGYCGLELDVHEWMDIEYEQYLKIRDKEGSKV
jgi:uncharacterized CHY-type Zn-finger protein